FPDNPPLNPRGNSFNSTNSWTGSDLSYQMDLDYYDLTTVTIIDTGVEFIDILLSTGQDYIMVNNIVTIVHSQLPDATIEIDDLGVLCENNNIDVEYTVFNINSTNVLPANTPIAFYAEVGAMRTLLGQTATVNDIPMNGSESGVIRLDIPIAIPSIF